MSSECCSFQDKLVADAVFLSSLRTLQRQLELAQKRNNQLNDVIEVNKGAETSSPIR